MWTFIKGGHDDDDLYPTDHADRCPSPKIRHTYLPKVVRLRCGAPTSWVVREASS